MDSRVCINPSCGSSSSNRWRKGWPLRAGGVANLCDTRGISYEKSVFCDMFHANETGWRECGSCGKRLHCGCIASKFLFELLDSGGVECMKGTKSSIHCLVPRAGQLALSSPPYTPGLLPSKCSTNEKGNAISQQNYADEIISTSFTARIDRCNIDRSAIWKLNTDLHGSLRNVNNAEDNDIMGPFSKIKEGILPVAESASSYIHSIPVGPSPLVNQNAHKGIGAEGDDCDPTSNGYLRISLGTSSSGNGIDSSNLLTKEKLASFAESREQNKTSVRHGQRAPHVLLKPSSTRSMTGSELTKDIPPQVRVPRPPGEGRGKNQLLPRYWPRITDKELQQISREYPLFLKSQTQKIVPLFEKVLSASDAGRIGRLVLPKACAEAYFPPISQPEGLPLTIQDAKGKDWLFQFRFWPNNNSRMYVLEGVTPCIQSMQLQAGDTVTFSRIDPEEKLVMGFRKAANTAYIHESQIAVPGNGGSGNYAYLSGVIENLPSIRGYSRPFHSLKGNADRHLNNLSEHLNMSDTDIGCGKADKHGSRTKEELQPQSLRIREKKRSRNISSKSKRLHIDSEDAIELKITWEEAQDLLRPPPSVKPSIVMIEDYEFEEYEEPPVFGKRSIFTSRSSGGNDQWVQCDNCLKWRRFPIDVLLPPKWMCAENSWDRQRCSCSVPEEISSNALQDLLRIRDLKKRKGFDSAKTMLRDVSALDALATAAVLGETGDEAPSTATTKHPRHRPGCSCIVCIQPPSGKGPKHKPTCACNVCMTVRRRFKTLMMRRKKRQSEREADAAQKKSAWTKEEGDIDDVSKCSMQLDTSENEGRLMCTPESISQIRIVGEKVETDNSLKLCTKDEIKGQIDLNCDAIAVGPSESHVRMMTLLQVASLPLDTYLKQHGLTSFVGDQQTGPIVSVLPSIEVESPLEESHFPLVPEEEAIIPGDAPLLVDQMASGST